MPIYISLIFGFLYLYYYSLYTANKIHLSDISYNALSNDSSFVLEKRGDIEIKVRGPVIKAPVGY